MTITIVEKNLHENKVMITNTDDQLKLQLKQMRQVSVLDLMIKSMIDNYLDNGQRTVTEFGNRSKNKIDNGEKAEEHEWQSPAKDEQTFSHQKDDEERQ